jgi:hypothetical protein
MDSEYIQAIKDAGKALEGFLEAAQALRETFARANMQLPDFQKIFGNGTREVVTSVQIAPPERPTPPVGAEADWIAIDRDKAQASHILLAVLHDAGGFMRAKEVVAAVNAIAPEVRRVSIHNAANRLDGKSIERTREGWKLIGGAKSGIIANDLYWTPIEICTVHEKAAHRRDAILHILGQFTSGLQPLQLLEQLGNCSSWMKAPVNKDLLKEDINILKEAGLIRRRGNTTKLELAEPKAARIGGTEMGTAKVGT